MQRNYLLDLLNQYQCSDVQEQKMHKRLQAFVSEHENCFSRALLIGHVTGSAWIVNEDLSKALLLHHRKLDRWLQPGGHSDEDPNTLAVALREAQEETGIAHFTLPLPGIFDIDIHTIPAKGEEAEHEHFDVRFLLQCEEGLGQHNEESLDLKWFALDDIAAMNKDDSIMRMIKKTRELADA